MTLFFAVTTAACLVGLGAFALHSDSAVRQRSDEALLAQAKLFSTGVTVDGQDGFAFVDNASSASGSGLAAIGSVPAGFVDSHGIAYATPSQSALPASAVIDRMFASIVKTHEPVFTTATDVHGREFRWVARSIPGGATAMALVGAPTTASFSHGQLLSGLTVAVALLVVLATIAGHVLSGRAMRPALRQVEQQEQFLREAAHELRTPLTTLGLFAESGLRDPAAARESLEEILDRLSMMNTVVTSLLTRARAETHGSDIEMRPLRLDQLVEVTVDDMNVEDRVHVETEPSVVVGNPELISQAVRNLVENALRHGGDGDVDVSVAADVLTVTDSGKGPSDANAPRPATASSGTGTGLSIVSWVAELHSARLDVGRAGAKATRATLAFPSRASDRRA
jgi:two-component system OmpR family sensor kinase